MVNTVFIGFDPRQPLAYNVLQYSIHEHASKPVNVVPLMLRQLPIKRRGLTEFTFSRFLSPYLCGFKGKSVFMDADMVVNGDVHELFDLISDETDVSVMKNQAKFEWASVMLFNNERCSVLTPEFIDNETNKLFDFAWAKTVGSLPDEWNHCVGYTSPRTDAKLYHYTQGIPVWDEVRGLPEDEIWDRAHAKMNGTVSWKALMGESVHAKHVVERLVMRLTSKYNDSV